jgi:2-dehydro-3-deoxygluconokinase
MALVVPGASGRLRHATSLSLSIAGTESNVAIGLCRLGIATSWVSALGDDELGELVLHRIRAEGIDTGAVRPSPWCIRSHRAGWCLFLHLSGITPALSARCAEFVRWVASLARECGVRVSYDVNYRSKLWDPASVRAFTCSLLPLVDVLVVGADEAEVLWGWTDEDTALGRLANAGPTEVVIKRGAEGSVADVDGDRVVGSPFRVRQVDPMGAGDAFAAGYLAGSVWVTHPRSACAPPTHSAPCASSTQKTMRGCRPDRS